MSRAARRARSRGAAPRRSARAAPAHRRGEAALRPSSRPGRAGASRRVRRVANSLVVLVDRPAPAGRAPARRAAAATSTPCRSTRATRVRPRREGGPHRGAGRVRHEVGLAVAHGARRALPRAARFADLALVLYSREEGPYLENELGPVLERGRRRSRGADLAICLEPTDGKLRARLRGLHPRHRDLRRPRAPTRPARGRGRTPSTAPARCSPSSRAPRAARGDLGRPAVPRGALGHPHRGRAGAQRRSPTAARST